MTSSNSFSYPSTKTSVSGGKARNRSIDQFVSRHGRRSTIATSQLPIDEWHGVIGDATLADIILRRLVHNAYKINLRGESLRKRQAKLTGTETSE